ncbi:hypothetical protein AAFF_G00005080 [Aldrovandia affinis]|uniref:Uncharacterized protein n=1 Tax=Aldrovandia affinis TaxID=143900 RepID=A0AAD7X587_9TELE|nr:hypothetical protein AAFF_G00005080 [Aldrovandia affinis]
MNGWYSKNVSQTQSIYRLQLELRLIILLKWALRKWTLTIPTAVTHSYICRWRLRLER